MHVNPHMDPQLVDKIANEVKSQGVFDQFRKDSMADVDTKPAYQNLRQRVENNVKKFLSEQEWTPELNKNQLREKLRRHITEAGFLDVGVERIVDQVVNPKISSVFQPKIEDIAYKYLKIPKPAPKEEKSLPVLNNLLPISHNGVLQIQTNLLPTDLEQVSPDSDKSTEKSESREDTSMHLAEKTEDDDDESPPFEPLEGCLFSPRKTESIKSNLGIDILKSAEGSKLNDIECGIAEKFVNGNPDVQNPILKKIEENDIKSEGNDRGLFHSADVSQQSQLSQVSSNSHLSIDTRDISLDDDDDDNEKQERTVNISEEAQMPKFNESSNGEGNSGETGEDNENANRGQKSIASSSLHFDIKKDEIKFEGTERKNELASESCVFPANNEDCHFEMEHLAANLNLMEKFIDDNKSSSEGFIFSKINFKTDEEVNEVSKNTLTVDSIERELCQLEKSEYSICSISQSVPKIDLKSLEDDIIKSLSEEIATEIPNSNTVNNSNHTDKDRDKEDSTHHSSSSSVRHKKRSKDRRLDKGHEKDRHKDRHYSSASKKSSTSNSRHSSSYKSSSASKTCVNKNISQHRKSKHHSRDDRHHSKNRDSKRNHKSSRSESSTKEKKKSSPTSRKTDDDHYASKIKPHSRKSTDSNDGDSSQEGFPATRNGFNSFDINGSLNSMSASTQRPNFKNSSQTSSDKPNDIVEANAWVQHCEIEHRNKQIIILDSLLDNPSTNFIQLGTEGQSHYIHSYSNRSALKTDDLNYFEESDKEEFSVRIKLLEEAMANCRRLIDLYMPDYTLPHENESPHSSDVEEFSSSSRERKSTSPQFFGTRRNKCDNTNLLTSATLHIDCIQYNTAEDNVEAIGKRFKFGASPNLNKISPLLSDGSLNSKENEFLNSHYTVLEDSITADSASSTSPIGKRSSTVNKTSQRYSSEDLYKPRPILGQRSKRRRLDPVI